MYRLWIAALLVVGGCDQPGGDGGGGGSGGGMIIPPPVCAEGETQCIGDVEQACQGGQWVETFSDACRGQGMGGGGGGLNACQIAANNRSYLGCEYWPVDLDNATEVLGPLVNGSCPENRGVPLEGIRVCWNGQTTAGECDYDNGCPDGFRCQTETVCGLNAQGSPFAIVVSNPQPNTVDVTLETADGMSQTVPVPSGAVASLFPQDEGFGDQSLNYSGLSRKAYRLTSTAPIVAYQFNPLDNVDVFSNDGSLLIPSHAYDTQYFALTLPTLTRRPNTNDYSSYVTVVGSDPNGTAIQVTPSANVRAGDGVPAMQAGQTYDFNLAQFDVLNLEAVSDGDMTGTRIVAPDGTTAFGVFVGHEATLLRVDGEQRPCCADHVEEQLFPISTWGANFAIARSQQRKTEPDLLRIVAHRNDTRVIFDPQPANTDCGTLNIGEVCNALITGDTQINATEPVLVGHMLMSTDGMAGDPALSLAVPVEQYRDRYTFLVPTEYDQQYISVVAQRGDVVSLDGTDVSDQFTDFGDRYMGARIRVTPGQRQLTCPGTCGVVVYGYSRAVSYLFAAGLDLEQITVP